MLRTERFEQVEVTSTVQLRGWLSANHTRAEGVWLVTWLKHTPKKYIDRWDVLDELLCFGWIDGLRRKLDENRTMQLITPRRQQAWAQTYKDRAERLEAEGRMAEPGRAAIARSRALGHWTSCAEVDALVVPDDLQVALDERPGANAHFEATAPSYRRNVLRWIAIAKKPETRSRRIEQLAQLTAKNLRMPQL